MPVFLANAAMAAHAMAGAFDTRGDCILAGACLAAFARSAYEVLRDDPSDEARYFYGETTAALLRRTRRVLFSERDPDGGPDGGRVVVRLQRLDAPRSLVLTLPATAAEFFAGPGAGVLRILGRFGTTSFFLDGAARCLSGGACVSCGSPPPAGLRFRACGRCRVARYCSTACQRSDYGVHRPVCAALLDAMTCATPV